MSEGTSIHDDGSNECIRLVRYHATAVLPIATVLTFAAAAIVYATYEAPKIGLTLAVFLLGLTYLALWRLVMPRIRKLHQIDMVAFAVYGLAVGCTWIGLLAGHGTPLSCGLLIVLSATAFVRHRSYATFVAIALTGYTSIAIWMNHFGRIELQLLIISPWFGVIGRLFLFRVSDEVTTARERMRSSLEKMQRSQLDHMLAEKKLVHAETMEQLGLIAANVAHDFNNSLQSISMLAEQIRLGIDPEQAAVEIQKVTHSAADTCRRMLACAGQQNDALTSVRLTDIVNACWPRLQASLPDSVTVVLVNECENLWVFCNPAALEDCLVNLVRNAVDACQGTGRITVSLATTAPDIPFGDNWVTFGRAIERDVVELQVTDDGSGMDERVLRKAFDPYFTTKPTGHGFGLASTLSSVRSCGGEIRVASATDCGTCVRILLPRFTQQTAQTMEQLVPPETSPRPHATVVRPRSDRQPDSAPQTADAD